MGPNVLTLSQSPQPPLCTGRIGDALFRVCLPVVSLFALNSVLILARETNRCAPVYRVADSLSVPLLPHLVSRFWLSASARFYFLRSGVCPVSLGCAYVPIDCYQSTLFFQSVKGFSEYFCVRLVDIVGARG